MIFLYCQIFRLFNRLLFDFHFRLYFIMHFIVIEFNPFINFVTAQLIS